MVCEGVRDENNFVVVEVDQRSIVTDVINLGNEHVDFDTDTKKGNKTKKKEQRARKKGRLQLVLLSGCELTSQQCRGSVAKEGSV